MTRLVTTGWETGDITESFATTAGQQTQSVVTATPTPRSPGSYCLKLPWGGSGETGSQRIWTLSASKTDVWVRASLYCHAGNTAEQSCISFLDSSAVVQGVVSWISTDLFIRAYRGDRGTLLGTSTLQFSADTWHTLEVRWQITSTSSGTVEVWVDGTRWLNLTGVDNTQTTNANVQAVALGNAGSSGSAGGTGYLAYDDFAVNDTNGTINNGQIGDGRVVMLKPNGAGSNTNQSRGGTDSGANWSQVDETPPSMTDYVYSNTAGTRDTYTLDDLPSGTWTVNAVDVVAFAQNSGAGLGLLAMTLKSGATTDEATAQALATSAQYFHQLYETDPNTGVAWTPTAVNALEAGTTVR